VVSIVVKLSTTSLNATMVWLAATIAATIIIIIKREYEVLTSYF
jgi:hypothetical protein